MKEKCYLEAFGCRVRKIRKDMKISQVKFYNELFPNNTYNEENIKKKMNAIERGKQKSIDTEFLFAICTRCDVSADYILGLTDEYTNHDVEFVCEYTGLKEIAAKTLHKWQIDSNNGSDTSKVNEAIWADDEDATYIRIMEKIVGIQYLKILNYLFQDSIEDYYWTKGKKTHKNLGVLYNLHALTMSRPVVARATPKYDEITEDCLKQNFRFRPLLDRVDIDAERGVFFQDDSYIWHHADLKKVMEDYAKVRLMEEVDRLINQVRNENKTNMELYGK